MEAHKVSPQVHLARRVRVGELDRLPNDVRLRLGAEDRTVCLVLVGAEGQRYTLIIDGCWLELATEAAEIDRRLVDDLALPRSVVDAVVAGWPDDWFPTDDASASTSCMSRQAAPDRDKNVWWSDDGIPHVSRPSAN